MVSHITDITFQSTSHRIQSTIMINEVRRFVKQLAASTIHCRKIIQSRFTDLDHYKRLLTTKTDDRDQLLSRTYTRNYNVLVCNSESCRTVMTSMTESTVVWKLKRPCHYPCTCQIKTFGLPKDCQVLGSRGVCSLCKCPNGNHVLIKFGAEFSPILQLDENIESQISTKEQEVMDAKHSHENYYQNTTKAFKKEVKSFMKLIVRFQYIVNHFIITSCKDEYEEYWLQTLKSLDKSADGDNSSKEILELYKKEKNYVMECLQCGKSLEGLTVSAMAIQNLVSAVEEFHKLPNFGSIIKNSADTGRLKDAVEQWLKTE